MNLNDWEKKYLKYKIKYVQLKKQLESNGGMGSGSGSVGTTNPVQESVSVATTNPVQESVSDSETNSDTETIDRSKKIIIMDYETQTQLYKIDKYDEDGLSHTYTSLIYFILNELKKQPSIDGSISIENIKLFKTHSGGKYCNKGMSGKINDILPDDTNDRYCLQVTKTISIAQQVPRIIQSGHNILINDDEMYDIKINDLSVATKYTGKGKLTYKINSDGVIHNYEYDGDIVNNIENGSGIRTDKYFSRKRNADEINIEKGTFINGSILHGEINYNSGTTYKTKGTKGRFEYNQLFGVGKITFPDINFMKGISSYDGIFVDSNILYGVINFFSGTKFETTNGYYKFNELNNFGKITFSDGVIIEGKFKDSQLEGKGKYVEPDGYYEEGIFKNGELKKGKKARGTRLVKEGKFKGEELYGKGKITYINGLIEEGIFKNSILHGQGKRELPNKFIIEGNFNMGILNGKGEARYIDIGITKQGSFQNDKLHGIGKMISNNITYEGNFVKDKLNGDIKVTKQDGTVEYCKYENDVEIRCRNQIRCY